MISVSADVATHADAVDLMRVLDHFHPWAVQLGRDHWVVVAQAEQREGADDAMALVSQWAVEHDLAPLPCRAGDDELLFRPTEDAPQ